MGDGDKTHLKLNFNPKVRLDFRGATITSDAGLLACRELDQALNLTDSADDFLKESRTGKNIRHKLIPRLALPEAIKRWSLTSVQTRLIKIGGRLVRHARRLVFQLAEVMVTRDMFDEMLEQIGRLSLAPG